MALDKDQVLVYKIILNMIMKALFGIVALGVFVYIVVQICSLREWSQTVPLTLLDTLLGGTLYRAFGHYFPKKE
jgi:hypothetical protein